MTAKAKLAESNFASLAEMMSAYAEEAVRVAWNDHRQRLDLSESSVDLLEQILDGQSAEDLEFQTRLWGSYFGEVIRRRFAGEWELSQYPGGGVPLFLPCGPWLPALSPDQGLPPADPGREKISPPSTRWSPAAWSEPSQIALRSKAYYEWARYRGHRHVPTVRQ